ncbi:MAG: hypothetical protein JRH18_23385 [Deltaproteobacteria bacterium]|nr:hypothetical protein [Deltaproteobacteria bacterium]
MTAIQILSIQPRDIYITLGITRTALEYLLEYLETCTADPLKSEWNNEKFQKAAKFVEQELFPGLDRLSEDIKNEFGPDSTQG